MNLDYRNSLLCKKYDWYLSMYVCISGDFACVQQSRYKPHLKLYFYNLPTTIYMCECMYTQVSISGFLLKPSS